MGYTESSWSFVSRFSCDLHLRSFLSSFFEAGVWVSQSVFLGLAGLGLPGRWMDVVVGS